MHARGRVVGLLTLALLAAAGCSPDASKPVVAPTPAASTPVVTPTPTPDQEDLDYASAEQAYRTFRAELNRVLRAGGRSSASTTMKASAGGEYLATFTQLVRGYRNLGTHDEGEERIGFVRPAGFTPGKVALSVCEDSRDVAIVRKDGERVRGEVRKATLEVREVDGQWKVWSGTGQSADSCD